jgi:16S rRNA processing protein RimM
MVAGSRAPMQLGVIAAPHGVKGQVRIKSFTAEPGDLAAYGPLFDEASTRSFEVAVVGTAKGVLICRIAGVDDRDAAEALRGTGLFVDRSTLPAIADPDEFYYADLIGLAAIDDQGRTLGAVKAVLDFGAGDLLEIQLEESGKTVLLPFSRETVPEILLESGQMVIDPAALAAAVDDGGGKQEAE